jgi:Hsp70 protein
MTAAMNGGPTGGPWLLGIDFGTTYTCAAVREGEHIRELQVDGYTRMPSAVFLDADGELLVGRAAESRGALAPESFEATPKRYMEACADGILLGDRYLPITTVVGAVLAAVWKEALLQHGGRRPDEVRLTYPATWQEDRRRLLREAAAEAGIEEVTLVKEPEAAAISLARQDTGASLGQGARTLVFDIGGGTFDVTVLRRMGNRFKVEGPSGGDDNLGGVVFEDYLYADLGGSGLDPDDWDRLQHSSAVEWSRANHEFRRRVREAKEAVSKSPVHPVVVPAPVSRELQVTREGLERLIREDVERAIDIAMATLAQAGVKPSELSAVYLVGGSSRIPLILHMVRERFGQAHFLGDPKAVVAQGAVAFESTLVGADAPPAEPPATATTKRPWWFLPGAITGAALMVAILFVLLGGGSKTLSGHLLNSRGEPMKNVDVAVEAQMQGKPKTWHTKTDGDGRWEVRGDAEKMQVLDVYLYVTLPYQGEKWMYEAAPKDPDNADPDWHNLDFEVRISGENAIVPGAYWGGSVNLWDAAFDSGTASVTTVGGPGAVVTFVFAPTGPMLDQTEGETQTYQVPVEDLQSIDDIPIGPYSVTAYVTRADGSTFPVVFVGDDDQLYASQSVDFFGDGMTADTEMLQIAPDPSSVGYATAVTR